MGGKGLGRSKILKYKMCNEQTLMPCPGLNKLDRGNVAVLRHTALYFQELRGFWECSAPEDYPSANIAWVSLNAIISICRKQNWCRPLKEIYSGFTKKEIKSEIAGLWINRFSHRVNATWRCVERCMGEEGCMFQFHATPWLSDRSKLPANLGNI